MKHPTPPGSPGLLARAAVACLCLIPAIALAHGDEDHGEKPPVAASSTASPRFEAHSDLFEVVGVVEHDQLTITVDRYASNEPVRDAKVEVEVGSVKGIASPSPDGSYTFRNALFVKAGTLPVSLTVSAGQDADLLAGDLTIGATATPADDAHAVERPRWWMPAGIAALLLIAALAVWRMRSRRASNPA